MWGWLTGGGGGAQRPRLGSFFQRPRGFSLESMRQLHAQLLRFAELSDADVVELLRLLSEFLVYADQHPASGGDQHEPPEPGSHDDDHHSASAGVFFDYFCEKNVLGLFVQLAAASPSAAVQVQLLQTLSILVQNIATRTSLYYLLSNNYVNRLLESPFAHARDDDVRDWFVTLLKALSLRLNAETVQFFFDDARAAFPLYAQALRFRRCPEAMVKVAVKTLTLNVYRVPDDRVRRFILQYQKMAYFRDVVEYAGELALQVQGLLNAWRPDPALADRLEEAVDEYIDHGFYLQDILDVNLPELCYKVGDLLYKRHVRRFLAASVLPDCSPPPQRVSTRLALYLLTRLFGIFEHAPLVNALAFMLLSPDASERCSYSAVALGAGSRQKSSARGGRVTAATATAAAATRPSTPPTPATPLEQQVAADAATATAKAPAKRKASKKKRLPHVFQAHSASTCDSPLCYLQTRFGAGEWPLEEVERFVPSQPNCFRQSILALLESRDEQLASAALLLVLAVVNNDAIDHTLLRELDLLPFRHRRHKRSASAAAAASRAPPSGQLARSSVAEGSGDEDDDRRLESSAVSSTSSSDLSVSSTSQVSDNNNSDDGDDDDSDDDGAGDARDPKVPGDSVDVRSGSVDSSSPRTAGSTGSSSAEAYVGQYPHWLMDVVMTLLARNPETRLLSTQLAARLLVDLMLEAPQAQQRSAATAHWLLPRHSAALKEIHSVSTHQVMESMRGAMADVDLFIYVLEDEFADFERSAFPVALHLTSASPFEFLVPPVDAASAADAKRTLHLRSPASEMEVCRKSMRAFLTLRKLRALVDEHFAPDSLEQFVAFRHPHTSALAAAAAPDAAESSAAVSLEGMVFLRCIWREQRFLHAPAKLLMVLNPEALVFAEKRPEEATEGEGGGGGGQGVVRLFAPIHRSYCTVDAKDERVLHVSVSSAAAVAGCRSYHKGGKAQAHAGELKSWHVSVVFASREDCSQAKAHVDLSRAEVRAFKLLRIEESLTTHVQIPQSADAESPTTKARRVSMDFEERLKQQEEERGE